MGVATMIPNVTVTFLLSSCLYKGVSVIACDADFYLGGVKWEAGELC